MVVGKVISIRYDETKKPLVYHRNRYFRIGQMIEPTRDKVLVNKDIFDSFHSRQSKFIQKCVGVTVRLKNKMLVIDSTEQDSVITIPYIQPKRDQDYKKSLESHLRNKKLNITLKEPRLKRLIIKNGDRVQRINFIVFEGILKSKSGHYFLKSIKTDSLLKSLVK